VTSATGYLLFYVNYGFNPRTNWPSNEEPKNLLSGLYAHWMTSVHKECQTALEKTCETMGKYYNKGKKEAPGYKIGDLCMLNTKNLSLRCPTKKFTMKMVGPFKIDKIVSPMAVHLILPESWKIHSVFHVKLLEPFRARSRAAPPDLPKVLQELDDLLAPEFEVE
jgi:hypothetical protein